MMRRRVEVLAKLLLVVGTIHGCGSSTPDASPAATGGSGASQSGGATSSAMGGMGGTATLTTGGTNSAGTNSAGLDGGSCAQGTLTSITQIMNGAVSVGTQVSLAGVVAISRKFLASEGAAGDCYWGVFVSEPIAQAVPYSGALVLALGTNAVADANGVYGACPRGTDLIPTDTLPGDVFSLTANVLSYVKSTCAASTVPAPAPEVRVGYACAMQRTERDQPVPAPATVADLTELTNSASEDVHRKWTGVLIRLEEVQSVPFPNGTTVGSTGSIQLSNGVRIRDRIYQPNTAVFSTTTSWASIIGISHLDVCTWSIEPRDTCSDFTPKSENCP